MLSHLFALFCGIGSLTFCVAGAARGAGPLPWSAGLLMGIVLFSPYGTGLTGLPAISLTPQQTGMLAFLLAMFRLRAARRLWLFPFAGGGFTVLWVMALNAAGYSVSLAWFLALGAVLTLFLGRRFETGFCSPELLQESLLLILAISLAIAVVPEVVQGWRTATGLQQEVEFRSPDSGEILSLSVTFLFVLLGIAYARYRQRGYTRE